MGSCIRSLLRSALTLCIVGVMFFSSAGAVSALAANVYIEGVEISEDTYQTLLKGTTKYNGVDYKVKDGYNPLYYFLNYKDLREDPHIGANPEALVAHWANYGRTQEERRVSNKLVVRNAQTGTGSYEYVVPSNQKTSKKSDGMTVIQGELHSNGGMTRVQEIQARSIAKQIADHVFKQVMTNGKGTQIEMVAYATGIVKAYCDLGTYTTEGKIYRTAYGVFIGHEYSCAGSTRALGLVLDYLNELCQESNRTTKAAKEAEEAAKKAASSSGSTTSSSSTTTTTVTNFPPLVWVHVNANKWDDQWCQIVCDNHEAYADAWKGYCGYGKHPNQGGKKTDYQTYYKFATENDVITTIPQTIDGTGAVTQNHQRN